MAFNPEIKGYMTFGKSFSRGGAFPLEAYEIWTDYDALVAYAANTDPSKDPSYIGQKVAYIDLENNKVVHYGIEIDGTLKELGCAPMGDEKTIAVAEDGTVSLKGIEALEFERDIVDEEGNPTGQKENVQFQPLMTKDGLIWVEPSKTTVEGLAALIDGLTARVSALENDRVTEQELADAVKAEADRAMEAEKALDDAIKAIDFVDEDELAAAVKVETDRAEAAEKALGERIDAIDFIDGDELTAALEPYAKTADVNAALAEKAKQTDLEALQGRVDAFLTGTGATEALDSLQELIKYINEHDDVELADIIEDIQAINDKLVGVDGTVAEYVAGAIAALNIGDYAKASELTALAERVAALEGDKIGREEFTAYQGAVTGAIATAKGEAIADAVEEVEGKGYAVAADVARDYATKQEITEAGYAVANDVARDYATKAELEAHGTVADGKYATKAELEAHNTAAEAAYAKKADVYTTKQVDDMIAGINQGNQESAAAVNTKLTNYIASNDKEIENLKAKDVELGNSISALAGQLGTTNTNVTNNTDAIAAINTNLNTNVTPKITALEAADVEIEKTLGEHTTAIEALNVTKIPALEGLINGNTTNINTLNGKLEGIGGTVVEYVTGKIGEIKPYDDAEVRGLIAAEAERADAAEKANAKAIVDLTNGAVKKNADDIVAINALLNTVDNEDAITSLKELAIWVEEHETEVLPVVNKNKEDIAALVAKVDTGDKTVAAYVADAIAGIPVATAANLGLVKASEEILVGDDGTLGLGVVSTDKLVQGKLTLILDGGDAEVPAN
jgi:hypothetical protein